MASAVGHVSGGHFNPAVTVVLCTARRFLGRDVIPYIVAQLAGAIAGAALAGVAYRFISEPRREFDPALAPTMTP
jgi:glycerol uptake facilitator-like aquaporin